MSITCVLRATTADQARRLQADPDSAEGFFMSGGAPMRSLQLQKAWHGLHYLLTSRGGDGADSLGFLLEGGEEIGEDLGYGPARLFGAEAVRQLDRALDGISDQELWSQFDPENMEAESIYPGIWDEDEEELREEYLEYYNHLKRFVRQASEGQLGMVILFT
jgi:hypothetical protein